VPVVSMQMRKISLLYSLLKTRHFITCMLLVMHLVYVASVFADRVWTVEDTEPLEGKIVERTDDGVILEIPYGRVAIEKANIKAIEYDNPPSDYKADVQLDKGNYKEAAVLYRKTLDRLDLEEVKRVVMLRKLGQCLVMEKQPQAAIQVYEKLISSSGATKEDKAGALGRLGVIYSRKGDYKKALECFRKSRSQVADGDLAAFTYYQEGLIFLRTMDYKEAEAAFRRVITDFPKSSYAKRSSSRVVAIREEKDAGEGLSRIQEAYNVYMNRQQRGIFDGAEKELDRIINELERIISVHPGTAGAVKAQYLLMHSLDKLGEPQKSKKAVKRYVKMVRNYYSKDSDKLFKGEEGFSSFWIVEDVPLTCWKKGGWKGPDVSTEINVTVTGTGTKAVLVIDYDLKNTGQWVQLQQLLEPAQAEILDSFSFLMSGMGEANDLHLKIIDEDGTTYGKKWPGITGTGSGQYRKMEMSTKDMKYYWGGDRELGRVNRIILTIISKNGGKGTVKIRNFQIKRLSKGELHVRKGST
jgi:tetratricopeptide (TPR) repeat protein